MNRFKFLISLQDQIIKCYKTVVLKIASRVYSFKNQENTKNSENVIFIPLWTPILCFKFLQLSPIGSQRYANNENSKFS